MEEEPPHLKSLVGLASLPLGLRNMPIHRHCVESFKPPKSRLLELRGGEMATETDRNHKLLPQSRVQVQAYGSSRPRVSLCRELGRSLVVMLVTEVTFTGQPGYRFSQQSPERGE